MESKRLPEWLIAEEVKCERWFMVHTSQPQFIAEILEDDEGTQRIGFPDGHTMMLEPMSQEAQFAWTKRDPMKYARLMTAAGKALTKYDRINDLKARQGEEEENDEF
ncbi:MAG: hypothetical protein ABSB91_00220 [Sedimentisphaerales bacterium]|jgi:hypothetical protein